MIRQKNKNLIRKILRSAGRMFTGLLASGVIALSGLPGIFVYNSDVFALKSGIDKANAKAVTNGYMLEITTGMHNGDDIEFIEIGYDGTDGKKYKQFLFPGEDSLANGRAQAYLVANDNNIATDFFNKYDYSIKSKWNDVGRQTGLRTDATDQYFFLTEKPIKKITKFDAFLGKKGKWTCLRLQLFKVDTIDGLRMAGNFSNSWYIDYTGTLMAELRNGQSNTWTDDNANYLHMTQKADLVTTFAEGENVTRGAQKKYGIRIDFADVYNAGLEYTACDYDTKELQFYDYEPVEALAVTFKYVDIFGYDRSFTAPVVLNSVYWAYKKNFQKEKIMGFAQQGESLFFEGVLPDFAALRSASLTVGRTDAEKATDINLTGAGNKRTKMGMASDDDDVKISAMALYDMETATVTPYQEGACLKYKFEGDPVYYHVATDYTGENAYAGETTSFDFKPYDKKPLTPVDNGEYYLIQFTTDNLASAGTSGDLFLQLTYANLNGYETKSAEISLREATRDLYGYWPSKMEDFAYMRGTSPGQTMQAVFVLKDVARFTGLTLRMGETNADDYQFKDLKIFALGSRGKRIIKFEDQNVGKNSTHLSITRDFQPCRNQALHTLKIRIQTR
ncbi:MAG: hypothetical protein J6Z02_02710 [Lachnospiraceae bacterium]|nr:hypothetical protein [Lachnospiraceae bacterium]